MLLPFLRKIGVDKYDDLTEEEKKTYLEYERVLQGREITSEEVRQFFDTRIEHAIEKLTTEDLHKDVDLFYRVELKLLRKLVVFLDTPKREKEQLQALLANQ